MPESLINFAQNYVSGIENEREVSPVVAGTVVVEAAVVGVEVVLLVLDLAVVLFVAPVAIECVPHVPVVKALDHYVDVLALAHIDWLLAKVLDIDSVPLLAFFDVVVGFFDDVLF